jgi:hypothetical protein
MWTVRTIRCDDRTHHISLHNAGKRMIHKRDMLGSVLNDTLTHARNGSKLDNENWYEWVSRLVEQVSMESASANQKNHF